jgi:organic radical activating enzyme
MKNYHCDRKFDSLKIDVEKKVLYSCWKAKPESIDFDWLKKNTGKLFNTTNLHHERQQMLENQRVVSCEEACFSKEDKNIWSPRLQYKGDAKKYNNKNCMPKVLDITLSGECNMSCSYCCKEFSSKWRDDIAKNGNYDKFTYKDERYILSSYDKALSKISQKRRNEAESYKLIEKEMELMLPSVHKIIISGGEPFLNEKLFVLLEIAKHVPNIQILSGLGIKDNRFIRCVERLKNYKNIVLRISAESTKENYEFNRYGNSWTKFLSNLKVLDDYKIPYFFNTTYSNLTVLDYLNFYTEFENVKKNFNIVYEPDFMSPYVLDDETKTILVDQFNKSRFSNTYATAELKKILQQTPHENDRVNLRYFLKEFSKRRNINLDFLPVSFKKWLQID